MVCVRLWVLWSAGQPAQCFAVGQFILAWHEARPRGRPFSESLWTQLKRLMRLVSSYRVAQVAPGGGHRGCRCPTQLFHRWPFQQPVSVHVNPVSLTVAAVSRVAQCVCVCVGRSGSLLQNLSWVFMTSLIAMMEAKLHLEKRKNSSFWMDKHGGVSQKCHANTWRLNTEVMLWKGCAMIGFVGGNVICFTRNQRLKLNKPFLTAKIFIIQNQTLRLKFVLCAPHSLIAGPGSRQCTLLKYCHSLRGEKLSRKAATNGFMWHIIYEKELAAFVFVVQWKMTSSQFCTWQDLYHTTTRQQNVALQPCSMWSVTVLQFPVYYDFKHNFAQISDLGHKLKFRVARHNFTGHQSLFPLDAILRGICGQASAKGLLTHSTEMGPAHSSCFSFHGLGNVFVLGYAQAAQFWFSS